MTRAVARTLRRAWEADFDLSSAQETESASRLSDLLSIEERVKDLLPANVLLPRGIRDLALANARRSPRITGPITIADVPWVAPLWRPLLNELCQFVQVEWRAPAQADPEWFAGSIRTAADGAGAPTGVLLMRGSAS